MSIILIHPYPGRPEADVRLSGILSHALADREGRTIRTAEELDLRPGDRVLFALALDGADIFRCVSLEVANVQLAQSMDGYSRETDGYKAYAVSYMLCKRYGVDAKEYEISKLDGVFQGQVPREDIPAALTDMRDTFKSLNGRMARAMGLTRDSKQKEQER